MTERRCVFRRAIGVRWAVPLAFVIFGAGLFAGLVTRIPVITP